MDNLSWNNSSNNCNGNTIPSCIWSSHYVNLQKPERAYNRGVSIKAEIMNEALLSSLDLQGIIWPHEMNANYTETDEDFLQQQAENLLSDSSGETLASHQLLPLPLITTSSKDQQVIRNLPTFSSSCGNASSGESVNYPDSFCERRIEDEHHYNSNPKPAMRKCEDSCNQLKSKRAKLDCPDPTNIDFRREGGYEPDGEAIAQVKEMIYTAAALRPVSLGVEEVAKKPRRKNLRISNDPQTAAARHRRERISERLRMLQRLVPGGKKMDTASMLDEAANYLKFLKSQVAALEKLGHDFSHGEMESGCVNGGRGMLPFPVTLSQYSSPLQTCIFPLPKH